MPFVDYAPEESLHDARARYFASSGLGDGGYDDAWVVFRAHGVPYAAFPNSAQRVRSVRLHDIHHVVAGYDTSWVGEAEIAAWELASGCEGMRAAWVLNSLALPYGWRRDPERVERAFVRGLRSRNLYDEAFDDALLATPLGELRERLGVDEVDEGPMTAQERARWERTLRTSVLLQLLPLALLLAAAAFVAGFVWVV